MKPMLQQADLRRPLPLLLPMLLFALSGVISLVASYDWARSLPWLGWLWLGVALYLLIVWLASTPHRLQICAGLIVAIGVLYALFLILQYRHLGFEAKFGIISRLGQRLSAPFPSFFPSTIQQNAAAVLLEAPLAFAIACFVQARGLTRIAWLVETGVIGLGLLLTGSRGSYVALAAGALIAGIAWLLHWRQLQLGRRALLGVLLGLGAALLLVLLLLHHPSAQRLITAVQLRAADRLMLYHNSFLLALIFPFTGIGAGDVFSGNYSHFSLMIPSTYLTYAHNLWISIWLAQGLLGLIAFTAIILAATYWVIRALRQVVGRESFLLWGGAIASSFVLLHGLTDAPQYDSAWPALLMMFATLGVTLAAAWLIDSRPLRWIALTRPRLIVIGAATVLGIVLFGRGLAAAGAVNLAAIDESKAALSPSVSDSARAALTEQAIRWADQALVFDPRSAEALARRGILALSATDTSTAIPLLEAAIQQRPTDQAVRKSLGYAYIWDGQTAAGVDLLASLDRLQEVQQELDVWPYAWRERGREDLAQRTEQAAALMQHQTP